MTLIYTYCHGAKLLQIYAEDVNFFNYRNTEQLEKACIKSEMDKPYPYTYPPRFIVEVSPEYAQSNSKITVTFTGARREISTEITLAIQRGKLLISLQATATH